MLDSRLICSNCVQGPWHLGHTEISRPALLLGVLAIVAVAAVILGASALAHRVPKSWGPVSLAFGIPALAMLIFIPILAQKPKRNTL